MITPAQAVEAAHTLVQYAREAAAGEDGPHPVLDMHVLVGVLCQHGLGDMKALAEAVQFMDEHWSDQEEGPHGP